MPFTLRALARGVAGLVLVLALCFLSACLVPDTEAEAQSCQWQSINGRWVQVCNQNSVSYPAATYSDYTSYQTQPSTYDVITYEPVVQPAQLGAPPAPASEDVAQSAAPSGETLEVLDGEEVPTVAPAVEYRKVVRTYQTGNSSNGGGNYTYNGSYGNSSNGGGNYTYNSSYGNGSNGGGNYTYSGSSMSTGGCGDPNCPNCNPVRASSAQVYSTGTTTTIYGTALSRGIRRSGGFFSAIRERMAIRRMARGW